MNFYKENMITPIILSFALSTAGKIGQASPCSKYARGLKG